MAEAGFPPPWMTRLITAGRHRQACRCHQHRLHLSPSPSGASRATTTTVDPASTI
jgi:hypothetical protein